MYYYNARWYDPSIGKFISEDSVKDDPNLYSYCGQNPVNNVDPTGNFSIGPVDFQTGFGLFSATVNAVATLTGNEELGNALSAFGLFLMVKTKIEEIMKQEAIDKATKQDNSGKGGADNCELYYYEISQNSSTTGLFDQYEVSFNVELAVEAGGDRYIAEVQSKLQIMGFELGSFGPLNNGVDGQLGDYTTQAIYDFQGTFGLPLTGEMDFITMVMIDKEFNNGVRVTPRNTPLSAPSSSSSLFILPTTFTRLSQVYGERIRPRGTNGKLGSKNHQGWDLKNELNTEIYAIGDGTVVFKGLFKDGALVVSIDHGNGLQSHYVHHFGSSSFCDVTRIKGR